MKITLTHEEMCRALSRVRIFRNVHRVAISKDGFEIECSRCCVTPATVKKELTGSPPPEFGRRIFPIIPARRMPDPNPNTKEAEIPSAPSVDIAKE